MCTALHYLLLSHLVSVLSVCHMRAMRLNGLKVSALGVQTRGPWVVPLFHWVAILGKLFTHIASPISQLQETGVQKGSFRRPSGYGD